MLLVKIGVQQVGAIKYNIYELRYGDNGTQIPNSVTLPDILSMLPFTITTDQERYRLVIHRFAHTFTLIIKIKQQNDFYNHQIGDVLPLVVKDHEK